MKTVDAKTALRAPVVLLKVGGFRWSGGPVVYKDPHPPSGCIELQPRVGVRGSALILRACSCPLQKVFDIIPEKKELGNK